MYADNLELEFIVDSYTIDASFNGKSVVGYVKWKFIKPKFVFYETKLIKDKVKIDESGRFVIPIETGKVSKVTIRCGNSVKTINISSKLKTNEIVAFDPVKKIIVIKQFKINTTSIEAHDEFKAKKFEEIEIPATEDNLKKYNLPSGVLNTTISSERIRDDLIRVEVTNKLETWYRFSVEIPEGYYVKEIVGDDGQKIVNNVYIDRTTGEIVGDLRWYVKNGTLYFYDDPVWGYNISLLPPQPNRSIAVELAYDGWYSGAGQISAIVFPFLREMMNQ